jgi:hypothetical protein
MLLGVSCNSTTPTPTASAYVVSATIVPAAVAVATVGQTAQVTVMGQFSDGSTRDITTSTGISSSNEGVATVAPSGLITAWAAGTTQLTATFQHDPPDSCVCLQSEPAAGTPLGPPILVSVIAGPPSSSTLVPTLVSPANNTVLPNCGPTSCTAQWVFTWAVVPGATSYHLNVKGSTAIFPVVDASGLTATTYQMPAGIVAEPNLQGWTWMVQALVNGVYQPWSATGTFSVASTSSSLH